MSRKVGEVGMKLYRKYIRPMHGYPGQHYEPKTEPIEKEEKWYPEEEREHLENKYGYLNKRSFSDLVFEEKYEPYDDFTMLKEQEEKPLRCDKCSYHREDGWCAMQEQWVTETDYCSFGAWEGQ